MQVRRQLGPPDGVGAIDRACTEGPVYGAGSIRWEDLPAELHYAVSP